MKKLTNFILLIICGLAFILYGCNESSKPKEPFIYTASLLMEDAYNILDYYFATTSLTKLEDSSLISSENCLFNSSNEQSSDIILDSLYYWTYCENGGQSYTETNYNIFHKYTFDFNGTTCYVEYTYQNNNTDPTSSGFRRTYTYDMTFSPDYINICYEDKYESHYNKTKYYIDICSIGDGMLMQYYISKDNGSYLEIYQFFYNENQDRLYFNSNRLKDGNSIKTLNDISLIDFKSVELPQFLYKI